jgi:hypothetical protein
MINDTASKQRADYKSTQHNSSKVRRTMSHSVKSREQRSVLWLYTTLPAPKDAVQQELNAAVSVCNTCAVLNGRSYDHGSI